MTRPEPGRELFKVFLGFCALVIFGITVIALAT